MRVLVSAPLLYSVSVVSKPTSTGCRETVGAEQTSIGRCATSIVFFRNGIDWEFFSEDVFEKIKILKSGLKSGHKK